MARGVTIEIQGLKQLQKQMGELPRHLVVETDAEMQAVATRFANRAVESAQSQGIIDKGRLIGSISAKKVAEMNYEVVSAIDYAAYQEFGTITHVKVPSDLVAYAAQFKGRGLRKNGGIIPRPYFFPQLPIAREELNKNLKLMMERLSK